MIDINAVRKLKVQDGDLLVVPENTDQEDMAMLAEALHFMTPDCKVVIVRGPIKQLGTAQMNKLGWYRVQPPAAEHIP